MSEDIQNILLKKLDEINETIKKQNEIVTVPKPYKFFVCETKFGLNNTDLEKPLFEFTNPLITKSVIRDITLDSGSHRIYAKIGITLGNQVIYRNFDNTGTIPNPVKFQFDGRGLEWKGRNDTLKVWITATKLRARSHVHCSVCISD